MPDKNEQTNNQEPENEKPVKNTNNDEPAAVPNPFEKGHGELSQEALDNLEQFKEAQSERD